MENSEPILQGKEIASGKTIMFSISKQVEPTFKFPFQCTEVGSFNEIENFYGGMHIILW